MDYQQRIDELKKQQREMLKRLEELERQTEPIKITRLEIDSGSMQELLVQANNRLERIIQTQTDRGEKLDTLERGQQELKQELYTLSHNWLDSLQENVDEIKDEMAGMRADISNIKATQSDHSAFLKEHGGLLKEHGGLLKATATKADISALKTTQDRQEALLQEILSRLPKQPE